MVRVLKVSIVVMPVRMFSRLRRRCVRLANGSLLREHEPLRRVKARELSDNGVSLSTAVRWVLRDRTLVLIHLLSLRRLHPLMRCLRFVVMCVLIRLRRP